MQRAHIGDQIVVAKCRAAFREAEFLVAEGGELLRNILYVPRREKLAFLYIDGATGFGRRPKQIRLPAEKRRDLQHVDLAPGNFRLGRRMHIRRHGNF